MGEEIKESEYTFYAVADVSEVPNGTRIFLTIGEENIVVFNIAGKLFAMGDVCTHDGGPVGEGELVDGYTVICPRHGARFDVRTGKALALPAFIDAPSYPVRVNGSDIEVGIRD
ncbi:MAG TPA: non-heme iron oxygenase ferredoxin subunit [Bellilinea sp.]